MNNTLKKLSQRWSKQAGSGDPISEIGHRHALLTLYFVAPIATQAAAISYFYGGSHGDLNTAVTTALLSWLPINPIGLYAVLRAITDPDKGAARIIRWAISWSGILVALVINHQYLLPGIGNLVALI